MKTALATIVPIAIIIPMLASCTSVVDDPFLRTGAVEGNWPSLATTVPAEYALAALPGLAATTVRQTGTKGNIEQIIVYANATDLAGENMLSVTTGSSAKIKRSNGAPSRSQVEAEMRSALAGVKMRISPVIADNAYGVFGYATGSIGKGGSCVYAWQFARNINPYDGGRLGAAAAAQIRMRYCSPALVADRIVAMMQGLRINAASAHNARALGYAVAPAAFSQAPLVSTFAQADVQSAETVTDIAPPVRRVRRPAAAEEVVVQAGRAEAPENAEKTIVNAVKVPMPGEAASMAVAETEPHGMRQDVSSAATKPSFVPLPASVASAAQ